MNNTIELKLNFITNKLNNNGMRRGKEMNYKTQMEAAKKGIVTKEIKIVAEKERISEEKLMKLVAEGKVAIPANINHKSLSLRGLVMD